MKPTIGRIVHVYRRGNLQSPFEGPFAGLVTAVWSETCINLAAWDGSNTPFTPTSVVHRDDGGSDQTLYWEWPPRGPTA